MEITQKYIKQTNEALSNSGLNLEFVALQISRLNPREQIRFFRLVINYLEAMSNNEYSFTPVVLKDYVDLCNKIMDTVNDHYGEQLILEGMEYV